MTLKLNMLPPSVNNMSVRVFVRAAGLPFEEENVWGQTQSDEYRAKIPSGLTPSVETEGLPKGALWESCAVMMYLANREGLTSLYPADLERRAMVDSANFYTMSILYPLVARATYPRLSFAGYPGEVATSDASDDLFPRFGEGFLRYLSFEEDPGERYTVADLDFDRDPPRLAAMGKVYNATDPDLDAFRRRGGKLLMWHSWADAGPSPMKSIAWSWWRPRRGRPSWSRQLATRLKK